MMRTLFKADWCDVNFLHFEVDGDALQRCVPFELDRFDDRAFVSLVAFTQRRLRPIFGGRIAAILASPLSDHEFLNLRTYVRRGNDRAIYFLSEWIPNRLAAVLGPMLYGLPYRIGELQYQRARRLVRAGKLKLEFRGRAEGASHSAEIGTLEHFLVERYVALTCADGVARRFEIAHEPWHLRPLRIDDLNLQLLHSIGAWSASMKLIGAQSSPGVSDVHISPPSRMHAPTRRGRQRQNQKCD